MTVREYALEQLHWLVRTDPWVREIFLAAGTPLDELAERILAIYNFDNFAALTAAQCAYYEGLLGLTPDDAASLEARREAIQAAWGGASKPSLETIQAICSSWPEGGVTAEYADGALTIHFSASYGVPDNVEGLQRSLRQAAPAHIDIVYDFKYLLIRDIHQVKTLEEMEDIPLGHFAGGG